ncbi:Uncharacterized protein QTN25_007079 [Entamoeba marina]
MSTPQRSVSETPQITSESPVLNTTDLNEQATEEMKMELKTLESHISTLESMLKASKLRQRTLKNQLGAQQIKEVPNVVTVEKVSLSLLLKNEKEEKWVECGLQDSDVEDVTEKYGLSKELHDELSRYVTDFKRMNGL